MVVRSTRTEVLVFHFAPGQESKHPKETILVLPAKVRVKALHSLLTNMRNVQSKEEVDLQSLKLLLRDKIVKEGARIKGGKTTRVRQRARTLYLVTGPPHCVFIRT
jgi:hypothetical protein